MTRRKNQTKRIARVERAAATREGSTRRNGFAILVIAVVASGLVLVGVARASRDAQVAPTLQDHWHSAYGVYDCVTNGFLPPFQSEFDPQGIHSHQDSLIHVHPFTALVTGSGATFDVFFNAMGASISDAGLELPGGEILEAGVACDGEPAVIQIVRWANAYANEPPAETRSSDLGSMPFLADAEAFTIARAPIGADIPRPPETGALDAVSGQGRDEGVAPPNTTAIPGPQDFGTNQATDD